MEFSDAVVVHFAARKGSRRRISSFFCRKPEIRCKSGISMRLSGFQNAKPLSEAARRRAPSAPRASRLFCVFLLVVLRSEYGRDNARKYDLRLCERASIGLGRSRENPPETGPKRNTTSKIQQFGRFCSLTPRSCEAIVRRHRPRDRGSTCGTPLNKGAFPSPKVILIRE